MNHRTGVLHGAGDSVLLHPLRGRNGEQPPGGRRAEGHARGTGAALAEPRLPPRAHGTFDKKSLQLVHHDHFGFIRLHCFVGSAMCIICLRRAVTFTAPNAHICSREFLNKF